MNELENKSELLEEIKQIEKKVITLPYAAKDNKHNNAIVLKEVLERWKRWVMKKQKVLFICTHNSARSQMAEGILRALYGDRYEAYSAGIKPTKVDPYAIKVMLEVGIDISYHRSKSIEEFLGMEFDYVVTVCDNAKEACPFFPGGKRYLHKSFIGPSDFEGTEEEKLRIFRLVRDEIKDWIIKTFGERHE